MLKVLIFLGFLLLSLRFFYWVGSSLFIEERWKRVLLAQTAEGLFLLFLFAQMFGNVTVLSMGKNDMWNTVGFFLLFVGVCASFAAKHQMASGWVYAAAKSANPQKLLTFGLFAYVRHPIYSSVVLSYAGAEMLVGSWLWVSALFLFIPFYLQARNEEKILLKHFGLQYQAYQRRVKMLIPFLL